MLTFSRTTDGRLNGKLTPRYVMPWRCTGLGTFENAIELCKLAGGKKYRAEGFEAIVFTTSNLDKLAKTLNLLVTGANHGHK